MAIKKEEVRSRLAKRGYKIPERVLTPSVETENYLELVDEVNKNTLSALELIQTIAQQKFKKLKLKLPVIKRDVCKGKWIWNICHR